VTAEPRSTAQAKGGGLLFGIGAYGSWGLFPAFFPLLKPAGALEVLAHRIVWTLVLMAGVLVIMRRLSDIGRIDRRTWLLLVCASVLVSANWVIYVYAVNNGHVVDAALGYFINPLVSVLLGVVIFHERLNHAQSVAVLIALSAVLLLAVEVGEFPFIALGLAFTFGLYGAVNKVVPTDPRVSVGLEAAIAAPFAIAYIAAIPLTGHGQFTNHGGGHIALTVLSGPITAIPLLMFAAAAQRLPLVTLGLLMYLTPAMQMTLGVVVDHEPMPPARWIGFALIWLALGIFSSDALRRARAGRSRGVRTGDSGSFTGQPPVPSPRTP
jgi:chloramphenicol-sensitive protein RarD